MAIPELAINPLADRIVDLFLPMHAQGAESSQCKFLKFCEVCKNVTRIRVCKNDLPTLFFEPKISLTTFDNTGPLLPVLVFFNKKW